MMDEPRVVWVEPSHWDEDGGWHVYVGWRSIAGPFATKLEAAQEARQIALLVS